MTFDENSFRSSLERDFLLAQHCIAGRREQLARKLKWQKLHSAIDEFLGSIDTSEFDWRQNSHAWARDIYYSLQTNFHSVANALGYADALNELGAGGNTQFHVTYYVRNSAINLHACRDKLACLVWAYYYPIDPDDSAQLPGFEEVYRCLSQPKLPKNRSKFWNPSGKTLDSAAAFARVLAPLTDKNLPVELVRLRHAAIHRREPRVYLDSLRTRDEFSAILPVAKPEHEHEFDRDLAVHYQDLSLRKVIKDNCRIDGIQFRQVELLNHRFLFSTIAPSIESMLERLVTSTCASIKILHRRIPFKRVAKV